jgi:murein DD-endopeptidase MepM/ murein hydrolase activator NlpD
MTVWLTVLTALANHETFAFQVETDLGVSLVVATGPSRTEVLAPGPLRPVSFSSDGRWLAAMRPGSTGEDLYLADLTAASPAAVKVVGRSSEPSWAPGGRRLTVSSRDQGIVVVDLSASEPKVTRLLPVGSRPDWSPSGGRIAFLGSSRDKGVFVAGEDGSSPRRVSAGLDPVWAGWSPDGRILAVIGSGKTTKGERRVVLMAPGSNRTKTLRKLDAGWASWAPDARHLLTHDGKTVGVLDSESDAWRPVALDLSPRPQWVDAATLAGIRAGKAVLVDWRRGTASVQDTGHGTVKAVAVLRGLRWAGALSSPFAEAPRPKPGELRLQGTVAQIDPMEGLATIRVMSVGTPDGMELHLAKPIGQEIAITPGSSRRSGDGVRPFAPSDLAIESEIIVVVKGTSAGVPAPLPVVLAVLPTFFEAGASRSGLRGSRILEPDGVSMDHVVVPMVFPVVGKHYWTDTFLADRDGGGRRHHGQDIMAPKMAPLVACFDGVVQFFRSRGGHNTLSITSDDGWVAWYMHINNDTPGTDDGQGGDKYAFAPGLQPGDRVVAGQLVAFCGDSGNAEGTAPHLHFELHDAWGSGVLNPGPSLRAAVRLPGPVYNDPSPGCLPKEGHVRWDVTVYSVDSERGVIVAELVATFAKGSWQVNTTPKKVYVRPVKHDSVTYINDPDLKIDVAHIRPGMRLAAFGPAPTSGAAMAAERVAIAFGPAR